MQTDATNMGPHNFALSPYAAEHQVVIAKSHSG